MGKKGIATKSKILNAAATIIESKGYHATGLNDIIRESELPKGSIYYHFSEGKDEIVEKSIQSLGFHFEKIIEQIESNEHFFSTLIDYFIDQVIISDFTRGCPISTVALETLGIERINLACQGSYEAWIDVLVKKAQALYTSSSKQQIELVFCLIQGAIMSSVTFKDVRFLENAKEAVYKVLDQ